MKVLVTGSAGHLGEALMRMLPDKGHVPVGLDVLPSPFTSAVGSIGDRDLVREAMAGVDAVLHTATLHKPHMATHAKEDFIATNVTGTLVLLEEAARASVRRFVCTSSTSAFGASLRPPEGAPAVWIDETVASVPKNIYGVTKTAAEDLCALFARQHDVCSIVLRASRFFPEDDDSKTIRAAFDGANAKANEFLFRRADLEDVASAHISAMDRAPEIGFGKYIVSASSPFTRDDLHQLRADPGAVVAKYFGDFQAIYAKAGFRMFGEIGRVYVNERARAELGWAPNYDFRTRSLPISLPALI